MTERDSIRSQVMAGVATAAFVAIGASMLGLLRPLLEFLSRSVRLPNYSVVVAGVTFIVLASHTLRIRRRKERGDSPTPRDIDIMPGEFTIDLSRDVPHVDVQLRIVNYAAVQFSVRDVVVARLTFDSGFPALDSIPLKMQIDIDGKANRLIYCGRALMDSEARAVAPGVGRRLNGCISVTVRGVADGCEIDRRESDRIIPGWIIPARLPAS